jgi:hypothetical protein
VPNDGFFVTTATNKGAFSAQNWMLGWSALDNNAFLSWRSLSDAPGTRITPPQCPAPSLSITRAAGNVEISFSSQSGCNYQLQSSNSLLGSWADDGSSVAGTGSNVTLSRAVSGGGNRFFRVVTQ